ncbi:MAG: hypothetical protein M1831_001159 [Alyxoria varia]|nr:MAG: hypothetical protein M1831_001159 [Alyxoria varia]
MPGRARGRPMASFRGGRGARGAPARGRGGFAPSVFLLESSTPSRDDGSRDVASWSDLENTIYAIDGQSYGFYKDLAKVSYQHQSGFRFRIDRVQSDPYAPPSRCRAILPLGKAGFPAHLLDAPVKATAVKDFLTRSAADLIRAKGMDANLSGSGWSGPKGGAFNINAPGQEILERSSCMINAEDATIELRFTVSLPARGRTILGDEAFQILADNAPDLVIRTLFYKHLNENKLASHVRAAMDQHSMRSQLEPLGLVGFVAEGSILPRKSGSASLPMVGSSVIPFKSPPELQVRLRKSDGEAITGMGIKKGVTVLTGGGFHGKSTLLEATQMGVYDHIPGDGREQIVTDPTAFKIRAEDGRNVKNLDISPFISSLPGGRDGKSFTSEDASGSTSMAANIQEALGLGSRLLLIDEDSSATNLLVRDQRMQTLINSEPITPFVSKARALYQQHGVSTLIVIGGCGDYLTVADTVIGMTQYTPHDLTQQASEVVQQFPTSISIEDVYGAIPARTISFPKNLLGSKSAAARGKDFLKLFPTEQMASVDPSKSVKNPAESEAGIELASVEQIVEPGQLRFMAEVLRYLAEHPGGMGVTLTQRLQEIGELVRTKGFDAVHVQGHALGDVVMARSLEVGAAVNRLRGLVVE